MTKIISGKKEDTDKKGLAIIKKSIKNILKNKPFAVFAIPGGRSIHGIISLMSNEKDFPWDKTHLFMIDERLVLLTDNESNFRQAKGLFIDNLISKKILKEANLHPFIYDKSSPDYGISKYTQELKKYGGKFDVILLGVGEDGHCGALFPNHPSIKSESEFFFSMHDSPKPPPDRMTFSKKMLLNAETAIALFYGEGKRDAFNKFRDDSISYISCPVKLIKQISNSYALTDLE